MARGQKTTTSEGIYKWYVVVSEKELERFREPRAAAFGRSELAGVAIKWRGSLSPKKTIDIKAGLRRFQGPFGSTKLLQFKLYT